MTTTSAWLPPDDPDLSEILGEAVDDTREKRYEVALAKFVWFHENALNHEPRAASAAPIL